VVTGVTEHFTNDTSGFTDVLVDDGGGDDLEEVCFEGRGYCTSEKSFASPWGAIEKNTFWWFDADSLEEFWVKEGKFDDLLLANVSVYRGMSD
jgi:hypothetical protein